MQQTRRGLLAGAVALAAPARAQGRYPNQPIKVFVGFPAGGTFDVILRAVGSELRDILGQPLVIETRSGAGGALAFTAVKNAAPDGYTLGGLSNAVIATAILENVPYDPLKDFTYISSLTEIPFAVAVHEASPFHSWQDLMAFGRTHPDQVFYGSSPGLAQTPHLQMLEVATRENLPWTVVPFRGSADCMVALLGGQLTFAVDTMISCAPHARAGKLRLLAVCSDHKLKSWPEVPRLMDFGYTTQIRSFYGVGGPAGMRPEVVATLEAALREAAQRPSLARVLADSDQEPRYRNSADMTAVVHAGFQLQGELIRRYGLSRAQRG